jgi:hypothetical protein
VGKKDSDEKGDKEKDDDTGKKKSEEKGDKEDDDDTEKKDSNEKGDKDERGKKDSKKKDDDDDDTGKDSNEKDEDEDDVGEKDSNEKGDHDEDEDVGKKEVVNNDKDDENEEDEEEGSRGIWRYMEATSPNVLALFLDQTVVSEQFFLSSPNTNYRPLRVNRLWPVAEEKGKAEEKTGIIELLMGLTGKELSIAVMEYNLWTYTHVETMTKPKGDATLGARAGEVAVPEAVFAHQKWNAALMECNTSHHYVRHTTKKEMEELVKVISDEVRRKDMSKTNCGRCN